jgi:hypothetical protein
VTRAATLHLSGLGGGSTVTLLGATTSGKRKARLWVCILSLATRSALLTVADILGEPKERA